MAAAQASSKQLQRQVSELLLCPICFEILQNAKSLPCLHTFCLQCLKDYWRERVAGQRVFCPVCRQLCDIPHNGLDGLPNNVMVQNLREIVGVSSDSSARIPCEEHPDKCLELYCLLCKVTMCRKCQATRHIQHDCQEVGVVAEKFAESLEEATNPVLLRIEDFQAAVDQHETDNWQFEVAAKTVDVAAKQHGEKLKNIVDGQVGELLKKLQAMKVGDQKEAKSRKAVLELAISEMKTFVSLSLELRAKGSPCEVIAKANHLKARASELLENYVTSGDQIPLVTFVPMNIDELMHNGQNLVGRLRRKSGTGKSLVSLKAWVGINVPSSPVTMARCCIVTIVVRSRTSDFRGRGSEFHHDR